MAAQLRNLGYKINRKAVQRIVQKLGLQVHSFRFTMDVFTIATRNSKWRSKSTLSITTSVASRNLSAASVLHSTVANISPHSKKRRNLLSYAFRSNFLGALQKVSFDRLFFIQKWGGLVVNWWQTASLLSLDRDCLRQVSPFQYCSQHLMYRCWRLLPKSH